MRVGDDGVDHCGSAVSGISITSMHRATELGGTCTVTGDSSGTTVVASLLVLAQRGPVPVPQEVLA